MTATSRVSSVSRLVTAAGSSSPVAGSNSAHLTVTPTLSAAITHGRTLASWSSLLTTISSPGSQSLAIAREMSKVSWVMLRPNTTPSGTPPSRSATAARAASTTSSALRSAGVSRPRLESGWVIACRIASPTTSGVWVPPGPSKYAVPPARLGKCARSAWTSYMLGDPARPADNGAVTLDEAVLALRAAGCVHAEDEAGAHLGDVRRPVGAGLGRRRPRVRTSAGAGGRLGRVRAGPRRPRPRRLRPPPPRRSHPRPRRRPEARRPHRRRPRLRRRRPRGVAGRAAA